jgi:hypothetical protein
VSAALSSIHRKSLVILALALAGAIPYGWAAVWSVALGGGIQVVNLKALERTVSALRSPRVSARGLRVALALRFALVVGLVGWAILHLPIAPLAFAAGLGIVVPAALWHAVEESRRVRAEQG